MSDWTAGYVADIGYTFGYYPELNPLRARFPLLQKGFECPQFETACELGFGQGVSVNYHAAGSSTRWYGTDFNPSQAAFARHMNDESGAGATLTDEAFAEFCARTDLPEFDFIGLHGIWSWISDENRGVLVDFIRRKLKVGGVLYVSYNTMPGWGAFAPLRHLMHEHAEVMGSEGRGIVSRIDDAIEFASKMLATNPLYARANPQVVERVNLLKQQNRHYLAHEFFNRDWHPMPFATMCEWLEPAKVQFAGSANPLDHVDALHLTKEQQEFLAAIPDTMFRESVRDFMVNQQFRRDYWIKGGRKLNALEQHELQQQERVVLVSPRESVKLKVQGALGELDMNAGVYAPVLDLLADHKPRTIGEMMAALSAKGLQFSQLLQSVTILIGQGHVLPCQTEHEAMRSRGKAALLNRNVCKLARNNGDLGFLVSPLVAGGLGVNRFNQVFLLALEAGKSTVEELARFAHELLMMQKQKILKDGKALETAEENLAELRERADEFEKTMLPIYKAVQII